jgi:hypothetical protein
MKKRSVLCLEEFVCGKVKKPWFKEESYRHCGGSESL